ncbi:MAG TPA: type II CAAX endopeptidase family protein [Actinophytocola sp.]|nr:type II CAAX endopeptidase family protein [Actinophytocola sp.]
MPRPRPRWTPGRQLVGFVVLAAALSWWPWPLTALNPSSTSMVPVGPTLAAIIVAALAGGRRELLALLHQLVRWRVHIRWYAVALVGPVVLIGLTVLATVALGATADTTAGLPGWTALITAFVVRTLVGGALGEELGWRGFLLPRLRRRHGALVASLLVGVVWSVWHLPLFLAGPATAQRPVLQFLLWMLALSVLHTWLYERTGSSVLITTIFHGGINAASSLLLPLFHGADYQLLWWLLVVTTTAWASAVVWARPIAWTRPHAADDSTSGAHQRSGAQPPREGQG